MHILGYIGEKCKNTPDTRNGPEIWNDITEKTQELTNCLNITATGKRKEGKRKKQNT